MAISPHTAIPHVSSHSPTDDAHVEVFQKTLAFYCALVAKGCAFSSAIDLPDSSDMIEQENNPPVDADGESLRDNRKRKVPNCYGAPELKYDSYNQPYIQYVFFLFFFPLRGMLTTNIQGARNVRPTPWMLIYSCGICRSLTSLIFVRCSKMIANGICTLRAMPSCLVLALLHPVRLLHPQLSIRLTAMRTLILLSVYLTI